MTLTDPGENPCIIVTSDEPWCDVWHTQLHYAFQLSKRSNVIFLGPPVSAWKISNLWNFQLHRQKVNGHLEVVNYLNPLPAVLGSLALWVNDRLTGYLIKKEILSESLNSEVLIWHFDRYRSLNLFPHWKFVKHIYHVIDPVANLNYDLKLTSMADLVVVTSPRFTSHYSKLNSNVIQIGQGVDLELYSAGKSGEFQKINDVNGSIMLLGTITDDIDFDFLDSLATAYPYIICLIGPDKTSEAGSKSAFRQLISHQNVKWLGSMPPIEFIDYLKVSTLGLIAYITNDRVWNKFRSPLKVISYLAAGKCVITTIDCEIAELDGKAIYRAESNDELLRLINDGFNSKLAFDNLAVNKFLNSISYENILNEIFLKLGVQIPEKFVD